MLRLIRCARWLSTGQIHRRFFAPATVDAARKRLSKLVRGRYLRMHQANRMSEALFTVGTEGRRELEHLGIEVLRLERVPPTQIEHFLAVNDIRIAAERTPGLSYFFAYWELPALHWRWPIIPDAVFSVEGRTIAVEYDRGMESLRYFVRTKMRAYEQGLDDLAVHSVLVVADRPARVATLARAIDDGSGRVTLATIDEVRKSGLPGEIVRSPERALKGQP